MYDRILVATDGSDAARRAADHAAELARRYDATLHAVYVVESRLGYDNAIVDPETVRANLRADGERALTDVEHAAGSRDVVTAIREGVPHDELLAYVDREGIDLVVLGATGRSAFKTVLLGSTAERLACAGVVPVLLVDGG